MTETAARASATAGAADRVPPTLVDLNHVYVQSWPRSYVQYPYEAAVLERLAGGDLAGTSVLEIGCGGSGAGLRLAVHRWGASRVEGVDQAAAHVASALHRTRDLRDRVAVRTGNAERLDAVDGTYDVVAAYHCLHHLQDWRAGVREAARVLRPGGWFVFSELTRRAVDNPLLRAVTYHPPGRFSAEDLTAEVAAAGLQLEQPLVRKAAGWWVLGAARKR